MHPQALSMQGNGRETSLPPGPRTGLTIGTPIVAATIANSEPRTIARRTMGRRNLGRRVIAEHKRVSTPIDYLPQD